MTAKLFQNPPKQPNTAKPRTPSAATSGAAKQHRLPNQLMAFANTLLLSDNNEDLYRNILEIAADLLGACQGSVMLIDENREDLHVVHTKGMSTEITRYLRLQVGIGIAGKVAKSGTPLLVSNVENDLRIAVMINRPHYKSKSLVSIPLKLNEKVLGVLNLSDKWDLSPFSEEDLDLLTSFSTLASLMIERTQVMEEVCRFEQLSLTDPLTGIYNRRFLNNRIDEEINRSRRQGLEFTILFIDLDHFKNYNDQFGHLAGDEALSKTAEIIKAELRGMDIVARFGGEEFCVLLPGVSKQQAQLVAERIREGVEQERFTGKEGLTDGGLTASLGIAAFPEDGTTLISLLQASDKALYQAKTSGRNRSVAFKPEPADIQRHLTNAEWRYCTLCERGFLSNAKFSCKHDYCNGQLGDIWDWEVIRDLNHSYPETPVLGEEYPLFGASYLKNLRRYPPRKSSVSSMQSTIHMGSLQEMNR